MRSRRAVGCDPFVARVALSRDRTWGVPGNAGVGGTWGPRHALRPKACYRLVATTCRSKSQVPDNGRVEQDQRCAAEGLVRAPEPLAQSLAGSCKGRRKTPEPLGSLRKRLVGCGSFFASTGGLGTCAGNTRFRYTLYRRNQRQRHMYQNYHTGSSSCFAVQQQPPDIYNRQRPMYRPPLMTAHVPNIQNMHCEPSEGESAGVLPLADRKRTAKHEPSKSSPSHVRAHKMWCQLALPKDARE